MDTITKAETPEIVAESIKLVLGGILEPQGNIPLGATLKQLIEVEPQFKTLLIKAIRTHVFISRRAGTSEENKHFTAKDTDDMKLDNSFIDEVFKILNPLSRDYFIKCKRQSLENQSCIVKK